MSRLRSWLYTTRLYAMRPWLLPLIERLSDGWHFHRWQDAQKADVIVRNPWWNGRWLMEARSCEGCGDLRARAIRRRPDSLIQARLDRYVAKAP